jgi:molybdate-binding protein/transcriptional regulator with XRE-family HTH domain
MSAGVARLAELRTRSGWSQAVLAEKCGVSRAEISAIETGRIVPSVSVALRIAAAFGRSVEMVFDWQDDEPSPAWTWPPASADDGRAWLALVGDGIRMFPVEPTAAGVLPHDGWFDGLEIDRRGATIPPERTLVVAGCDPLVGLLCGEMAARHGVRVLPLLRSSTQALELLKRGLVHAAGLHFADGGRSTNHRVVRHMLGRGYRLVHQMRWDAGVVVQSHRQERTISALLRANVRWVNREPGSAARLAFDALLASRRRPPGYAHVVHDHRAVAATVSSGWAEAGMCVRPAAAEAGLSFIPLQQEAYELCVPADRADDPRVRALIATLQSSQYRRVLGDVPGCTVGDTGDVRSVS